LQPNVLATGGNTGVEGRFMVTGQTGTSINIMGTVTGLSEGKHGFAVLEGNDIVGGCDDAGDRFAPEEPEVILDDKAADARAANEYKKVVAGDLGNILADANGRSDVSIVNEKAKMSGWYGITGRTLAIYESENDLGEYAGDDEAL